MSNLLPPGSHAERLSKILEEAMFQELLPENGELIYVGCCINMDEEALNAMTDSDEWLDDGNHTDRLWELRERCQGFDIWEKQMGYGPEDLHLEDDWSVGFGKGMYNGHPCLWVCHSHIEYVWALPVKFEIKQVGTISGRISCSHPNLSCKPRFHPEELRAAAKSPTISWSNLKPSDMKVVPYACSIAELEEWGCPYCGYDKWHIGANTKTGMPAALEGTYVRFCNSCTKFCYALAEGVQTSRIPFGTVNEDTGNAHYPSRGPHPRIGILKHSDKVESSQEDVSEIPT